MRVFLRQLTPALVALVVFTVLLGLVYPLATTAVAQVAFGHRADGSTVERDGVVVGSELIGQPFVSPQYLHPRPSAAGAGYDGSASSGSNAGPLNEDFLDAIDERVAAYRDENGLPDGAEVPVDAVTASGSGLDPHISIANARLQAPRVAAARGLPVEDVLAVIEEHTDDRGIAVLGEPGVNVLLVNVALDELSQGG
ncbi:MAG: K(+)-transporting ATPase subunit C [Acidimicrobiales bacterium]|nr:K(+)-transporting ATPase subunit C [Acidimicrobiales bacterium]MCB9392794.1 K(+)-transporting ATPase subunit C [Acidimicrobiaceae bacterium]